MLRPVRARAPPPPSGRGPGCRGQGRCIGSSRSARLPGAFGTCLIGCIEGLAKVCGVAVDIELLEQPSDPENARRPFAWRCVREPFEVQTVVDPAYALRCGTVV